VQISVIGAGYLGLTHAACLAAWGHEVVVVERDAARLRTLRAGHLPLHEPGLADLVDEQVAAGRLRWTGSLADIASCEVHFVCVGTPQGSDGEADLRALEDVVDALAELGTAGLVVGKSTVPVGTATRLLERPAVRRAGTRIAWNPEFLREGTAVHDTLHPDRLVLGLHDGDGDAELTEVYRCLVEDGVPVVRTGLATAELAKVSANLMLAARVSIVNVLAETCERSGADMQDLATVVGLDRRIGPHVLTPGIGYGGGCLPKDSRAFAVRAAELGVAQAGRLVDVVDGINLHQRRRTVDLASCWLDGLAGRRVGVLGAAFKGGSDDLRESPALDVICRLLHADAHVRVHDPSAGPRLRGLEPALDVVDDALSACRDAELVMVLTDWPEFADLDPTCVAAVVAEQRCLDGRQVLDAEKWREAGWELYVLGAG
jgi:UDPglucose 6-dehydrogenase